MTTISLVQLDGPEGRRVALVEANRLRLIEHHQSVYAAATAALESERSLVELIERDAGDRLLDYDEVYEGRSSWRILPSADHPLEPARCLVSGTGLTHMASARRRDAMHTGTGSKDAPETDSMRMFRWGVEGGKPAEGAIGTPPEWFYKGNGSILRGHLEALTVPTHAEDGGEEPEIAGVYIIDPSGAPRRIGLTAGNEFSDHKFEKRNYLYLAPSKLRQCAIGPELALDPAFDEVPGSVAIERRGEIVWSQAITSGERVMCHSRANIEHHHFKFDEHRRPGDLHIHFFGADAFSFGSGVELEEGDVMRIEFTGFGRALRNPLKIDRSKQALIDVRAL